MRYTFSNKRLLLELISKTEKNFLEGKKGVQLNLKFYTIEPRGLLLSMIRW
jgi:hypothetical protein